ncbi:MAG: hypothetical protein K8I30_23805 [Anaerolineae bacterium]|nr:hypothetical protein [Anaerolineae bacterium]
MTMIFAHTLDKVICGEKWQTRRLVKPGETLDSAQIRVSNQSQRTVYEVGKSYAVQPNRGQKAVARILLTGLRREMVLSINDEDARAEGFPSKAEFVAAWQKIHGLKADLSREVWVLEFTLYTTG